ncbi:MAG: hypothetical protein HFI83_00295 [Eubacterium sp.]|nr:hypothetical protein [Eubacterium sp.]
MHRMIRYLKMDFYRLFRSPQFYISIASVFLIYMVSSLQSVGSLSVFDLFYFIKFFSLIIVLFACSSFAYANSLLEDWEHGFYQSAVLRGSLKAYVYAKSACCFCAAVLSIIMGTMCFVFVQSLRIPLADPEEAYGMMRIVREQEAEVFGCFLQKQWMPVYFLLSSMVIGFLAGILALAAMWLSLVAKNRMFAMCMPIAAYYILVNCIKDDMLSINGMYFFSGNLLSDPLLSFGCTVFVTACGVSIFMVLIYRRMRRMVRGVKR